MTCFPSCVKKQRGVCVVACAFPLPENGCRRWISSSCSNWQQMAATGTPMNANGRSP